MAKTNTTCSAKLVNSCQSSVTTFISNKGRYPNLKLRTCLQNHLFYVIDMLSIESDKKMIVYWESLPCMITKNLNQELILVCKCILLGSWFYQQNFDSHNQGRQTSSFLSSFSLLISINRSVLQKLGLH